MSYMIKDLKKLYESITDDNGNFLPKMRGVYRNAKLSEREFEFLKGLIHLVLTTRIISENTKNYIKSYEESIPSFVKSYNLTVNEGKQLNVDSVYQNRNYDKNKLLKFFPANAITLILSPKDTNIADYEKMLNNARTKYAGNKKILSKLALNISKTAVNDNLSEEGFNELLVIIGPYTKKQMEYISKNLPIEYVGYLNYLISAYKLEGEDLKRYKLIRTLLEGEEFNEPVEIEHIIQNKDTETSEGKTAVENNEQTKTMTENPVIVTSSGLNTTRIQYDSSVSNKDDFEDMYNIDLENIDFGDITDADVE